VNHRVLDASSAPTQQLIEGLAGVLDEVVPVGHLDRLRRPLAGSIRERARPIPYEHLHVGMHPQPGHDRLSFMAIQQIDGLVRFEVHQDRAVAVAPRQREFVDPQHVRDHHWCSRRAAQQAQVLKVN
jgi:hypothetical protein